MLRDEALAYFKAKQGLYRLLDGLVAKYRSLGRMSGKIKLAHLSAQEAGDLQGLFGRPFTAESDDSISFSSFEKALQATKFGEVATLELLEAWAGEPLISNTEARQRALANYLDVLKQTRQRYSHPLVTRWCQALASGEAGQRNATFDQQLDTVCRALVALPREPMRLPVFAAQVSNNPHAFDLGKPLTSHFLAALKYLDPHPDDEEASATERITNLLERFNLIRDDVANFVTLTGLLAFKGAQVQPVWQAAAATYAVLNMPLRELYGLTRVAPSGAGRTVFVVENSTVFSAIADHFPRTSIPLICSHGQFKLAFLRLLDLLVADGCEIAYTSDFDPEGLLMAQRLCDRHRLVRAWRMDVSDYRRTSPQSKISSARLKKLKQVEQVGLVATGQAIAASGRAGYQEHIIDNLIRDLEEHLNG